MSSLGLWNGYRIERTREGSETDNCTSYMQQVCCTTGTWIVYKKIPPAKSLWR